MQKWGSLHGRGVFYIHIKPKSQPQRINLCYDALKRKDVFKEITDINFNTFVAYRHLIAIAITFQNDRSKSVDHYLKKYGLF